MKCENGVWYHRGRSYATLYEALAAVWPRVLSPMGGQKEAAPGTANTGNGKAETQQIKPIFNYSG